MNPGHTDLQQLLDAAHDLYAAEIEAGTCMARLLSGADDDCLSDGIAREALENRKRCFRLEAFIAATEQVMVSDGNGEPFSHMIALRYKRVVCRNSRTGYQVAAWVSARRGEHDMALQLSRLSLPTVTWPVTDSNPVAL